MQLVLEGLCLHTRNHLIKEIGRGDRKNMQGGNREFWVETIMSVKSLPCPIKFERILYDRRNETYRSNSTGKC